VGRSLAGLPAGSGDVVVQPGRAVGHRGMDRGAAVKRADLTTELVIRRLLAYGVRHMPKGWRP